jgi:TRAP-type C4-dicarboxylate transport system permease small subunit
LARRLLKVADRSLYLLIVLQVIAMTVVVDLQVFNRYVVDYVFGWEEETARYLMIWSSFLAAAYAYRSGEQLGMEFVIRILPKGLRRVIRIGAHLVVLIFLGVVAYQGFFVMLPQQMDQISPAVGIPMALPYAAIPVSAVMMGGVTLLFLYHEIRGIPLADEGNGTTKEAAGEASLPL